MNSSLQTEPNSSTLTNLLFIMVHGAGSSGKSFTLLAKYLTENINCTVFAFDMRSHGRSTGHESELCFATLSHDLNEIIEEIFVKARKDCHNEMMMDVFLVGHSLGGSLIVNNELKQKAIASFRKSYNVNILGVVLLDIVEEIALTSLRVMPHWLANRQQAFSSLSEAIHWSINNHILQNMDSAKISIENMLKQENGGWVWRVALENTKQYWHEWFSGLTERFLTFPAGKLLVLVGGNDRLSSLDKNLMIAQMQGKFQIAMLPVPTTHYLHEDDPKEVGTLLIEFANRNARIDLSKLKNKTFK